MADTIYFDFSLNSGGEFSSYINVIPVKRNKGIKIEPVGEFDDSEFSDFEIELIDSVVDEFKDYNSKQLIEYLHQTDSLWHKSMIENDLENKWKGEETKTSNFVIELYQLIKSDPGKSNIFQNVQESRHLYIFNKELCLRK